MPKEKKKKIRTKQLITIGRDSVGSLIEIDIFKSGNNYEIEPVISPSLDKTDQGLQNLKKNLKELLTIENLGKEMQIAIKAKNNKGKS